ncbi:MAG: cation:proton antiporter [Bacteroidales bacterium]|nr:cation:proton antiporter [Bacteroidales bacterium]
MFEDSYILIIIVSVLVILSYSYSALSVRTKIPSVLLLLLTGIVARIAFDKMGYEMPSLKIALQFFGIIGVILIVLEGALELKLRRDKIWLIVRSFFSALVILAVSAVLIASGIKLMFGEFTFYICLVNALPFAVISSAIAIPSVTGIDEEKKEFIVYESIFSDILGILIFNFIITNPTLEASDFTWVVADFFIIIIVSVIVSGLVLLFIDKTTMNIKFFLMIAIMVLLYAFGKIFHLSSLLMILFFGLILNNLNLFSTNKLSKYLNIEKLQNGIDRFKMITAESAFLIRTLFFFIFGFTLQLALLLDFKIILSGLIIIALLFGIRFLYLKLLARRNLYPELFIAPRGLITILLFYAIPKEFSIGAISEGLLFFVILVTSLIMMFGLLRSTYKIPEMEIYIGNDRIEK